MRKVKRAFCYQKLFWPFTVWINCSSDLKNYVNSRPPASNFKSFSWSLEQFFLTAGQNNFGNKIPFNTDLKICEILIFLQCWASTLWTNRHLGHIVHCPVELPLTLPLSSKWPNNLWTKCCNSGHCVQAASTASSVVLRPLYLQLVCWRKKGS